MSSIENLPRMRTLSQCMEHIKEQDPNSALTPWGLRQLVLKGEIPGVVQLGSKRLINLDLLLNYLNKGNSQNGQQSGVIRLVPERMTKVAGS